jgi:nitroimidazol reductase NimA-like FMN-containing flavoprotein (pyridoxamine 5'-phosphate oxidase superfamily)
MSDQSWLEELMRDQCLHLLREAAVGRLGIVVEGAPIVLPVNYRVVDAPGRTWIALRTRPGNVIDRASMSVALEIDGLDPVHNEGWSVLVRGTLHRVDTEAAAFRDSFDPEPWMSTERDAWLVIEPFAITGRRLHAPDREWAFQVEAYL